MDAGGRNQEKEQRGEEWKQGLWTAWAWLRDPPGVPAMPFHSDFFFFFSQNEKCSFYVRNHYKFQISEVSWSAERRWREDWSTGCFLAVGASWLID